MTDERHDFASARIRLEEIVAQVRKKDTSLERSLDLLEEGVRLANVCTELSDHTEWRHVIEERDGAADEEGAEDRPEAPEEDAATAGEPAEEPEDSTEAAEEPLGDGAEASSAE